MKVTIKTSSYNEKRYSKPYIGIVDFSYDAKGVVEWGTWIGKPGDEGLLVIEAKAGDIIMKGQKDNRNSKYSETEYFQLKVNGSLSEPFSRLEAYKRSKAIRGNFCNFDNDNDE